MSYSVTLDEFDALLASLEPNTEENPYDIIITEAINKDNEYTVGPSTERGVSGAIKHSKLYVNLTLTVEANFNEFFYANKFIQHVHLIVLDSVTVLYSFFVNSYVKSVHIEGAKKVGAWGGFFQNCQYLTKITFSEGVGSELELNYRSDVLARFCYGCVMLEEIDLKNFINVKNINFFSKDSRPFSRMFEDCENLKYVHNFHFPLDHVDLDDTFKNCTSLKKVYLSDIAEAPDVRPDKWRLVTVDNGTTVTVYDGSEERQKEVPRLSEGNELRLFNRTEELSAAPAGDTELTRTFLSERRRLGYAGTGLPTDRKSFVLWGDKVNSFRTNMALETPSLIIGQGGAIRSKSDKGEFDAIRFDHDATNNYGNDVVIGAGALTVIGGGEAADTYWNGSGYRANNKEIAAVVSDSTIELVTNLQSGFSNGRKVTIGADGFVSWESDYNFRSMISKPDNSGWPCLYLLSDVSEWYKDDATGKPLYGFTGTVTRNRGGYMYPMVEKVFCACSYQKSLEIYSSANRLMLTSTNATGVSTALIEYSGRQYLALLCRNNFYIYILDGMCWNLLPPEERVWLNYKSATALPDGVTMIKEGTLDLTEHPIGEIYMSADSKSPADIWGGTWQSITDRFLLAASSAYPAGSTGGATHKTLSIPNLPRHTHEVTGSYCPDGGMTLGWSNSSPIKHFQNTATTPSLGVTGGDGEFSIMPPYLAVYMWKRTG